MIHLLLLVSAALAAGPRTLPHAQAPRRAHPLAMPGMPAAVAALDRALEDKFAADKLPGMTVLVSHEGRTVYERSFGVADSAGNPMTEERLQRVASITKPFTALAIHQLVDQGAVGLDESVTAILPWLVFDQASSRTAKITVGQLLSHTAGVNREPHVEFWTDLDRLRDNRPPRAVEQRAGAARQTPAYEPGQRVRYSNMGYWLLGEIVAARGGAKGATPEERYKNYVERKILRPLGMRDSSIDVSPARLRRMAEPFGFHDPASGRRPPLPLLRDTGANAPGWGLVTTARDLKKFLSWLDRSLQGAPARIISAASLKRFVEPVLRDPYNPKAGHAMGLMRLDADSGSRVGHTGSFAGFRASAMLGPALRLSVATISNTGDFDRDGVVELVFRTIGAAVAGKPVALPAPSTPPADPSVVLARFSSASLQTRAELVRDPAGVLKLRQGGVHLSLTPLSAAADRQVFRIGDEGPYPGWLGEKLVLELENGKPKAIVVAGAYRLAAY